MSFSGSYSTNVDCSVDIFTPEGGKFNFIGGALLAVTTTKTTSSDVGTFSISIAPETLQGLIS